MKRLKKGTIIENVRIDSLGYGGVGVARMDDGKVLLIKGALPQSTVDCKIVKNKKDYSEAHIVSVKQIDDHRLDGNVKCPHYLFPYHQKDESQPVHKQGCGGCKRQIVSYDKQLQLKQSIVESCFSRLAKSQGSLPLQTIIPAPEVYGYRNKIEYSFGKFLQRTPDKESFAVEEHWNMGFHKQGEFSKVVDVDQCYLSSPRMHDVFEHMKVLARDSGLPVYDAMRNEGFFRHLVIREGVRTEQMMLLLSVCLDYLVDHPEDKEKWETFKEKIKKSDESKGLVTTCVVLENNGRGDAVRGPETKLHTLWGEGVIYEELHIKEKKLRFQISPFSFFQTNTLGAEILFDRAFDLLESSPKRIIDLYCGSGTIGLAALGCGIGDEVVGVEIVPSAVEDAGKNARINGLEGRARFYCGKAEKVLYEELGDLVLGKDDVVIVDPPREGLHAKATEFLAELSKKYAFHLLYISCNPNTMARDAMLLAEAGFTCEALLPVDMFPHTHHIETIGYFVHG